MHRCSFHIVAAAAILAGCSDAVRPDPSSSIQVTAPRVVTQLGGISVSGPVLIGSGAGLAYVHSGARMSINEIGQITGFGVRRDSCCDDVVFRWTPYGNATKVFTFPAGSTVAMHPEYGALVSGGIFWSPLSGPHAIAVPRGFAGVDAMAINASGVMVGGAIQRSPANPSPDVFVDVPAFVMIPPGRVQLLKQFSQLSGQNQRAMATGINSHGVIVGIRFTSNSDFAERDGLIWQDASAAPKLVDNMITAINDCGEMTEIPDHLRSEFPKAFEDGPAGVERALAHEVAINGFFPDVDPSFAQGISETGWVAGTVEPEISRTQAVLWRPDGEAAILLPPLAGDFESHASTVNMRGEVAGTSGAHAVKWTVPSAAFAGTVALIRAKIASVNGLTSEQRTQLEADLDAAAGDAARGYVGPARADFAAYASHLGASGGALSARDRAILSDAGVCLSESLVS